MKRDPRAKPQDDGVDPLSRKEEAEQEALDFTARVAADRRPAVAAELGEGTRRAYLAVRELAAPMLTDRTLDEDIRAVREAVEQGTVAIRPEI